MAAGFYARSLTMAHMIVTIFRILLEYHLPQFQKKYGQSHRPRPVHCMTMCGFPNIRGLVLASFMRNPHTVNPY